jgi:Replication-relaxation
MTSTTKRRRRFTRSRSRRDFVVTDRVLSILRALARFRILTIDQIVTQLDLEQDIHRLPPVSPQKISRLLRDLFDTGYVERLLGPVTNLTDFDAVHRLPTTYALAKSGATHIAATDHIPIAHLDWPRKNRQFHSSNIDHTVGIADFVINLLADCRNHGLDLIDHRDLVPYMPPSVRDKRDLTLSVIVDGVEYTRRPDRVLAVADRAGARLPFVLEWHSGEVPGGRAPDALWRGYRQSNFSDTIWIYWMARQADAFKRLWGLSNFRVLTVTASDKSIVNLSRKVTHITGRPTTNLFLFTTPSRVLQHGPLAPIWYAPQNAFDSAHLHYSVEALRAAVPMSVLDTEKLSAGGAVLHRPNN